MILTLSLPRHQSVGLLAQDCLGILCRRFGCVVERMRCMPFNERASFIELSMLGLPLKWKYESSHEYGPESTVANISLSWKTLYQRLWDSWGSAGESYERPYVSRGSLSRDGARRQGHDGGVISQEPFVVVVVGATFAALIGPSSRAI